MSNRSFTQAICTGSARRTSVSTLRSRLRCIMSAEPIQTSRAPLFSKQNARECSRNRPKILMTLMFSLKPGTPGRRAQIPRTNTSTQTPACDARYRASMTISSTRALHLMRMPLGKPASLFAISRSMRSIRPVRTECGATKRRAYSVFMEYPDSTLKRFEISSPTSLEQVIKPMSS